MMDENKFQGLTLFGKEKPSAGGIIVTKGSPLVPVLTSTLLNMHEEGIISKILHEYQHTSTISLDQNETFIIPVGKTIVALVLVTTSWLASCLVFLLEKLLFHLQKELLSQQSHSLCIQAFLVS